MMHHLIHFYLLLLLLYVLNASFNTLLFASDVVIANKSVLNDASSNTLLFASTVVICFKCII